MTQPLDTERLLTTREVANILGLGKSTIEQLRLSGNGPRFLKIGKAVRYRYQDLLMFQENAVRRSTSDPGPAAKGV